MILIKGMEMPKNCLECVFYRRTDPVYDYCCISSATPKGYVPNDCPLVPVPPHGRLIDADALEIVLENEAESFGFDVYACGITDGLALARSCIETVPTVIPADKDGES